MKNKNTYLDFNSRLYEGGNAFQGLTYFPSEELHKVLLAVRSLTKDVLKLNDFEYKVVGSYGKKKTKELINDIDIIVSLNTFLKYRNIKDDKEVYNIIEDILIDNGLLYRKSTGIGTISVKYNVENSRFLQIDILPVRSMEWGEFSYYSPNLKKQESKYKGLYRNAIFEAISKTIHFEEIYYEEDLNEYIKKGDVKSYQRYRYLRNFGLYKVKELQVGKRKLIYEKDRETYTFVSDDPEAVVKILLGDTAKSQSYMTFEKVWEKICSENYIYYHLKETIIENFKTIIVDRQKNTLPEEVILYYSGEIEEYI